MAESECHTELSKNLELRRVQMFIYALCATNGSCHQTSDTSEANSMSCNIMFEVMETH